MSGRSGHLTDSLCKADCRDSARLCANDVALGSVLLGNGILKNVLRYLCRLSTTWKGQGHFLRGKRSRSQDERHRIRG